MNAPLIGLLLFALLIIVGGVCTAMMSIWLTELRALFSHHGSDLPSKWLGVSASAPLGIIARPTFTLLLEELPSPLSDDHRIVALVTRVRLLAGAQAAVVAALIAAALLRG